MSMLNSPLEALALNYVSFGFLNVVNNFWTWIAVITAAVSFWRIRASTTTAKSLKANMQCTQQSDNNQNSKGRQSFLEITKHVAAEEQDDHPGVAATSMSRINSRVEVLDGSVGITQGKFTIYYEEDCDCESEEEVVEEAAIGESSSADNENGRNELVWLSRLENDKW